MIAKGLIVAFAALSISGTVFADNNSHDDSGIAPQALDTALEEFAERSGLQVIYLADVAKGKQSPGAEPKLSNRATLEQLLASTNLEYEFLNDNTVTLQATDERGARDSKNLTRSPMLMAQNRTATQRQETAAQNNSKDDEAKAVIWEEIVVTGTSIRGVIPESSSLEIYDAIDIRDTGAITAEGFVSTLTQNNNTLTAVGTGASTREDNRSETNGADIRGLGVGTTLVLLNGRRMAPASGGRTADLSLIPLAAVERVEVLTDGASAIYGADAIGGVINFILKRKLEGAHTNIGVGAVDGGRERLKFDQSFGLNWSDGNALLALGYLDLNALDASDRSFSEAAAPRTLVGDETRASALATVRQHLGAGFNLSGDLLGSTRKVENSGLGLNSDQFVERAYDSSQTVLNLAIDRQFGDSLTAELVTTFADYALEREQLETLGGVPDPGPSYFEEDSDVFEITAKLDGELLELRSGSVLFSLGAGYREEEISRLLDRSESSPGSVPTTTSLSRDANYAFAELLVPLIAPDQNIPGVRRLEFNLAARYDDFSDFGGHTSPKIGLLWSPFESLKIRGTYGESFKAPTLLQLAPGGGTVLLFSPSAFALPDIWSSDNSSVMLFASGAGKQDLGPEDGTVYTVGMDFALSGLTVSATYFSIEYTNRIAEPDASGGFVVLVNPQDFPTFFDQSLSLEQVTTILNEAETITNFVGVDTDDAEAVRAVTTVLFDNRSQNLAASETDGIDFTIDYTTSSLGGDLSLGIQGTKTFNYDQFAFENSQPFSRIDTALFPADFKARFYGGIRSEAWSARLNVNYVDDYENPFDLADPVVDSWTTIDLVFSYGWSDTGSGLLNGLGLGLSVRNILDEDPPFLESTGTDGTSIQFPIGFDPANANPFGRIVDLQITKQW